MPAAKSKKFVIPAFRRAQRPGSFSGSLVFLLLLLSTNLFSQSLNFRNYSGEEILPSSTVYASFQDSKGYIWFATDHGVSRYDGYGFTQLSLKEGLADHEVFNFFEDSRGRIWFHTANGRVCYFKNGLMVSSVNDTKLAGLDSESYITGMCEDPQGNIWIATIRSGIIKYDEKKGVVRRYNLDDEDGKLIYALLWVGERLLVVTERNAITFRTGDEEIDVEKRKTIWPDIPAWGYPKCIDLQNGRVLISDYIAIIQYDLLTDEITTIQDSVSTYNLTQDQDHAWFCTITGALQYSKKQQKITGQILKDHKISSVLKDSEGNHWFTSLGDGIFYSTSPEVFSFTAKDGLPGKVNCLAKDAQNRIWIGYKEKNAISYVDRGRLLTKRIANPYNIENVTTLKINFYGQECWLSSAGFGRLTPDGMEGISYYARDVVAFRDRVWLAGSRSLTSISLESFNLLKLPYDRSSRAEFENNGHRLEHYFKYHKQERARRFFIDNDSCLWAATDSRVFKTKGDSLIEVPLKYSGNRLEVIDFAELSGGVKVLATGAHGVAFMENDRVVAAIGEAQGMSSSTCNAISVDDKNTVWVATNRGLNKITGYPRDVKVEYFTVNDGLLSNSIIDVEITGDTVWTAAQTGLNYFHRDRLKKNTTPPQTNIEALTLQGKNIPLPDDSTLIFGYNENDIGIKYVGLSYNHGGNVLYRYRLHPDDPWRYTRNTSVYLPELQPGSYKFTVASKHNFSAWSPEAFISFTIEKAFWQSIIFKVVASTAIAALIFLGAALYVRVQRRKMLWQHRVTISELRSLRSQMNPHFIFNALNSIQGVLLRNSSDAAQVYFGKFGKLMRQILDHSDKTSISIAEEIDSITNYLEIEQLRTNSGFQFEINVSSDIDVHNTEIPAMILQPFIENSIWHGFMDKRSGYVLVININPCEKNDICIVVRDNGIGRKKSGELNNRRSHKSKGIQLVKERLEILNFQHGRKIDLTIRDLEDQSGNHPGTEVTIKIPCV